MKEIGIFRYSQVFMASLIGVVGVAVVACKDPSTPVGMIGKSVDLTEHLSTDIAAGQLKIPDGVKHQKKVELGDPSATVQINWRALKEGNHAYLLSVDFEVIESAPGIEIEIESLGYPQNQGTEKSVVEVIPVVLTWRRQSLFSAEEGTLVGEISAEGKWLDKSVERSSL